MIAFACFEICVVSITVEKILEKIKLLREERGFTHGNMTPDVRIGQSAYSKTEKNPRITVQRLLQIATALEVDISYFFEEEKIDSLVLNKPQTEIGNATKQDIVDLNIVLRSIKKELVSLREEVSKSKAPKAKKSNPKL